MTNYIKQAEEIAAKLNIKLSVNDPKHKKHFAEDKSPRWVFPCILKHNGKTYSFEFGQSIAAGATPPTIYDVLSCLTKYDPDSFENFCGDYGYDTDSRKAEKVYKAVVKEWEAMTRLFNEEELEQLRKIQ